MINKCIVSLAAIVLACHSPAEVVRSMLGARGAIMANPKMEFGGLTFTALSANSKVSMLSVGSAPMVSLETSSDGINWSPFVVGETTNVLASVGDKIYFRAGSSGNTGFATSAANYNKFEMSGTIAASGNIMSLLSRDFADATVLTVNCYRQMFQGCTSLVSAPQLPATVLANSCYYSMFQGCTSLASAPALPTTTLAIFCYGQMFQGCTSLVSAPQLPATTILRHCYREMFSGCTSLASAPQLPATVLAEVCYYSMFSGCKSLVSAPALPATTLAPICYQEMFSGCKSLVSAPALPATTLADDCYYRMFYGCAKLASVQCSFTSWGTQTTDWMSGVGSTGTRTFTKPAALPTEYGTSKIPVGWTVVDL